MYLTIFIVTLIVVIMFHEFGHYATAKAFGMKAEKFFFGFGPTLWSTRRGETEYGVKAIPAGGFVKISGMSAFEQTDPADAGRLFYEKPGWQRAIVLAAGSLTHFLVALLLLFLALWLFLPVGSNVVGAVTDDSPAAEAGLSAGDEIVAVDGVPTGDFEAVSEQVAARGGETVPLRIERDGETTQVTTAIAQETPDGREQGFLGISPDGRQRTFGEALSGTVTGDFSMQRLSVLTVQGLGQAFSPEGIANWLGAVDPEQERAAEGPMSVVGIGQVITTVGDQGDAFALLAILAQLNIVIGLLNLLPLPPLDGGHLASLGVEQSVNGVRRLRGKAPDWRLDPAVLTPVALMVILFFIILTGTIIYIDIVNPASQLLQ